MSPCSRQAKHASNYLGPDAFALKRGGDLRMNQAQGARRSRVEDKCSLAVLLELEAMQGRIVEDPGLGHTLLMLRARKSCFPYPGDEFAKRESRSELGCIKYNPIVWRISSLPRIYLLQPDSYEVWMISRRKFVAALSALPMARFFGGKALAAVEPKAETFGEREAGKRRRFHQIREDCDRHRRSWSHLSRRDGSIRDGATQSRHVQRRMGLVLGIPLLRQLHHGIQPHASERNWAHRTCWTFLLMPGTGPTKFFPGAPPESRRRLPFAFQS